MVRAAAGRSEILLGLKNKIKFLACMLAYCIKWMQPSLNEQVTASCIFKGSFFQFGEGSFSCLAAKNCQSSHIGAWKLAKTVLTIPLFIPCNVIYSVMVLKAI